MHTQQHTHPHTHTHAHTCARTHTHTHMHDAQTLQNGPPKSSLRQSHAYCAMPSRQHPFTHTLPSHCAGERRGLVSLPFEHTHTHTQARARRQPSILPITSLMSMLHVSPRKPGAHAHTKELPAALVHVPPFRQGCRSQRFPPAHDVKECVVKKAKKLSLLSRSGAWGMGWGGGGGH
jgi:hypothetical protein